MKLLISKMADCLFNITAGCVIVSLFQDYEYSFYVSIVSYIFAVLMTILDSKLKQKEK